MNVDLVKFGQMLKRFRQDQGLSLDAAAAATGGQVSRKTLLRYESGQTNPKYEILSFLSLVYRVDLCEYFSNFRSNEPDAASTLDVLLRHNLSPENCDQLKDLLTELLRSKALPDFSRIYYERLWLFVEGVSLKHRQEYKMAIQSLTKALRLRFPDFTLKNYANFFYFSLDYRILENLLHSLYKKSPTFLPKILPIYAYLYQTCPQEYTIYPHICAHYAFIQIDNDHAASALPVLNAGIEAARHNLNHAYLAHLYYFRGVAEYHLNSDAYRLSFMTAYILSQAFGDTKFQAWLQTACREAFDFDLMQIRI